MKFNEKLIEIRKKEGLSQEELGYKLNVTRQTISKWELGQTTPEMDKLIEISKLFDISVDELIKDSETNETNIDNNQNEPIKDQPIVKGKSRNIIIVVVLVLVLVLVIVCGMIGIKAISGFSSVFNKITDAQGKGFDMVFGMFDKATDVIDSVQEQGSDKVLDIFNNASDVINNQIETNKNYEAEIKDEMNSFMEGFNNIEAQINENKNKVSVNSFNGSIELYSGTASRLFAETMLDNIVTSNKKNDRKITVKYNKIKTQDTTEIKNIKKEIHNMKASTDFDISCEYDKDGYIYEVTIEKM